MQEIIIRVSTEKKAGRGHINRCLNIRKYLKYKVTWHIDDNKKDVIGFFNKNDEIIVEKKNSSFSFSKNFLKKKKILLIDNYKISKKNKEELANFFKVISIEDNNTPIKIDMLICPYPFNFKYNKEQIILNGFKYAPIKPFKKIRVSSSKKINILVSMGAYDSKGITIKAIKAILIYEKKMGKKINTNIIVTSNFKYLKECKKMIKGKNNMKLIINTNDINYYIKKSVIGLGAAGVSQLERLYEGLPSILIAQNKKQKVIIDKLVEKKSAIKANNSVKSIIEKIDNILSNNKIRMTIKNNGKKLIDGKERKIAEKINLL